MVGAVGEGSAYTFLPLVVYGIYLVFEKDVTESFIKAGSFWDWDMPD